MSLDLFFQEGKLPSECLKEGHCKALQTSFFECKRSMVSLKIMLHLQKFTTSHNNLKFHILSYREVITVSSICSSTRGQDSEEEKDIDEPTGR